MQSSLEGARFASVVHSALLQGFSSAWAMTIEGHFFLSPGSLEEPQLAALERRLRKKCKYFQWFDGICERKHKLPVSLIPVMAKYSFPFT